MPLVNTLPPDLVEGPHMGFVEFKFINNEYGTLIIRVPIQDYEETEKGKTGEELLQMFYTQ